MKGKLQIILLLLLFPLLATAQNWNLANGTQNMCSGTFFDPGGNGNYGNNQNITGTICSPTPGQCISVTFNNFNLSQGSTSDYLYVYDGPNTSAPASSILSGAATPGTITSSTGCLTFNFVSDGATVSSGWQATINCQTCAPDSNTPACPSVNAGPDINANCSSGCQTLTATVASSAQTQSYTVINIPYTPLSYTTGTNQLVDIDDVWGQVLNLGFNFCYYGQTYNQLVVGANGCISFNTAYAGTFNEWATNSPFPNPDDHVNQICAPYHDINPAVGFDPNRIKFELTGVAPCRIAKISWNNVPMFSCTTIMATQQILLYETTNVIETYIGNKPLCSGWNGGEAIHGIENQNGTVATVVPGRNYPAQWTATNDGKRFVPSGAPSYSVTWFQGVTQIGTGLSIQVCPTQTTTYTSRVIYTKCDGTTVTVSDDVTVNVSSNVNASISPPAQLGCSGASAQVQLQASSSSPSPTYTWSTSGGNIVSGGNTATPTVSAAGTYTVTVTSGACQATASVQVTGSTQVPNVSITPPPQILCNTPASGITITASSSTPGVTYAWTAAGGGNIAGPTGNTSISATTAGTYIVVVTNPSNGCTASQSVSVSANTTPPDLNLTQPPIINCSTPNAQVNITAITGVSGATFNWTGTNIISGQGTSSIVAGVGSYSVVVTNPANGCTAAASTSVSSDLSPPNVSIAPPPTINCLSQQGQVQLQASSSTPGVTYSWSASGGGNITQNPNTDSPKVDQAGTYTVVVTNPANGCTAQASVSVNANITIPNINITPPTPLTCASQNTTGTTLSASSSTPSVSFEWTTSGGGTITSIPFGPTVTATTVGTYTVMVTDNNNGCNATASVNLTVNVSPPSVNINPPTPLTCATQGGSGTTLTATSGAAGATFVWSGTGIVSGGNTATPTVNGTGPYNVVVTDPANGCTASASVSVTVNNTPPTVNINPPTPLTCATQGGSGTTLTATSGAAGATFVWSGTGIVSGGNTATPTVNGTGPYNVVVTDPANGCTASASVSVTVNNTPPDVNVPTPPPLTCASQGATGITLNATSSVAGATFVWTGAGIVSGANTASPTVNATGSYTVVVTNPANGCTAQTSVSVTVDTTPPNVSIAPPQPLTCLTQTAGTTITASSSTTGATFAWSASGGGNISGSTTGPSITATAVGTYNVTVTGGNGCTASSSVNLTQNITPPSASINPIPPLNCTTQTAPFNLAASTNAVIPNYLWSASGGGAINGPNDVANPSAIGAGTYSVIITDSSNGCSNSATVSVSVNNTPPNVSINPPPTITCANQTIGVQLSATSGTAGVTYQWTGAGIVSGANTATPTVNGTGPYTVVVTDPNNGCTAQANVTVTINNTPPDISIAPPPTIDCSTPNGGQIQLSASSSVAGITYNWAASGGSIVSGGNTATPTVVGAGTYSITVTDPNNGCTNFNSVTVTADTTPPNIIMSPPVQIDCNALNGQVSVSANSTALGATFQWSASGGGNIVGTTTGNFITADAPGTYNVTVTAANGCTNSSSTTVTVAPPPSTTISGAQTVCSGGPVTLSASPGYASYQWTPAGSGSGQSITVNPTANTTYSVVVTDSFGCTASASTNVPVNQPPTPTIGGSTTFCPGSNTILDAGSGYTNYAWAATGGGSIQGPTNTQTITAVSAGTYNVTVTDSNGCTGSASVAVSVNSVLTPNITGDLSICTGESTQLDAGPGFDTYTWSNGNEGQVITVNAPGTYTVSVTDNAGCAGTAAVTVVQNPNPTPTITGDNSICEGTTTTLSLTGSFAQYAWGGNATGFNPTLTVGPGSYSVTVTDSNGCTGSNTFTVVGTPNPTPTISGNQPFCIGQNIVLEADAGYATYQWTASGGGNIQGPANGQSITITSAGTYTVVVTDANGCTGSAAIGATTNPNPNPTITGDLGICPGESTTLSATAGFSQYLWNGGAATQDVNVNTPGAYSVIVTDANGCTGSTTTTVLANNPIPPTISGDTDICTGQSTTLSAGGYTTYNWSTGQGTASISVTPTGNTTYAVTVTDANGCTATDEENVFINPNPQITIGGSTTFCSGSNTVLSVPNTFTAYNWSPSGNSSSIVVIDGGNYAVTVTDNNGCTGSAAISVTESTSLSPVVTGDLNICPGESTTLDAGSGFAGYQWSGGLGTGQTITVNTGGTYSVTVSDASGCSGVGSATVVQPTPPAPTISGQATICTGNASLLDAGTGFASYQWSDGSLNQTLNVSPTTNSTYSVTVTNAAGCTGSDSFDVSINANLTPTITGTPDFCQGQSSTLNAGSYTNYSWSSGQNTQTITVTSANTYTVTVSDASGCSGTDSFVVTVNNNPIPTINGDFSICVGENTTLDAGAFTSYSWSNSQTTATISVSPATTTPYNVTVTDANGCTGSDAASVTVNSANIPIIDGDTEICEGSSTTLNAVGAYTNYSWSNGENTASISVSPTGNTTYNVTVTDANGCTAQNSVNITINANPTPTIGGSTTFCAGETTTLDAGSYTAYVWSNGEATQTISVDATNTYCVTVTDSNGCVGNDCVDVSESSQLNPIITGNLTICQGENTNLDAGTGFDTYTWSPSGNTQTINVTTGGTYCVTVTQGGCTGSACVDVIVNPNPSPTISGTTALCNGVSTTLDAGAGYTGYIWQPNGSFNQTISVNTSGNYSVTVTDANGCSASDDVTVNVTPNPTPIIGGDMMICTGETTILDAGTFNQYTWLPNGESTATISVVAGGVYSVTVTDANGCTGSNANTVQENTPQPPFVSGDTQLCETESTTIDAGSGYVQYNWLPTGNGQSFTDTPTSNTTYSVTVTDANGCTEVGSINVEVNPNPQPSIGGSLTFCPGGSSTLDAGAGFVAYQWSPAGNTQTLNVTTPGEYCVTVTDDKGCQGMACVFVSENAQLTPVVTGDTDICTGETSTLDAGIGFDNYQWSNGLGNTQTVDVNTAGTYTVTVSQGSCSGTGTITINVHNNPIPTITGAASICEGNTSTLDAGNGYAEYIWDNGSFEQTYTAADAGIYSVTVTDSNGCTGTDNFELTVNANLTPQIDGDLVICQGETTTLDAGVFDNYNWSVSGQNNQTISVTTSGTYSVTVTDVAGCSGSDAVNVTVNPNPTPAISGTLTICEGETTTLDAGLFATYQWSVAGQTNQTISVTTSGTYSVTVTDANGCSATDEVIVTVNPCNCTVPATPTSTVNSLTLCEGQTNTTAFTATPAPNTSVVWYDGPNASTANLLWTGNSYTPTTAGTYYAFALNVPEDECISEPLPFTLTINPMPNAALSTNPINVCIGDDAAITFTGTATPTATYTWTFGAGAAPATATGAGPHTVSWTSAGNKQIGLTVTDNGCTDTANGTVGVSSAAVQITPATVTIGNGDGASLEAIGTSGLNGDMSYTWSPGTGLSCTDCAEPTATPAQTTVYTVSMIDEYGCEASAQATVTVSYENIVIIPNAFSPNGDNINDIFKVSGQNIANIVLNVRNRWGNDVYKIETSDLLQGWDGIYNSQPQEIGVYVYYLVVTFNDGKEEFFKGNLTLLR